MTTQTTIFTRVRRRFAAADGFTMLPAMMAVMVGSLISIGAWSAAHSDLTLQNTDRYSKIAYSQAESGVSDYVQHMAEDPGYWQYCDEPPGPGGTTLGLGDIAVNDTEKQGYTGTDQQRWLPYASSVTADAALTQQYTIDLIPANGKSSCKAQSVRSETMIDKTTGTIRVRVTGRAGPPAPSTATTSAAIAQWRQAKWKRRSVVIEFRRKGFLDYAYFTDKEGRDPTLLSSTNVGSCSPGTSVSPADLSQPPYCSPKTACTGYYSPATTAAVNNPFSRYYYDGSSGRPTCTEITFIDTDNIRGPFHTNDAVKLASNGGANFGADPSDPVEVFDGVCPFRTSDHAIPLGTTDSGHGSGNCPPLTGTGSVRPDHTGPIRVGASAGYLPLPESNEDLQIYANPNNPDLEYRGYTFYGKTKIVLKDNGTFDLTNPNYNGGVTVNLTYPTSGVIYVDDATGASACDYNPRASDFTTMLPTGCAQAEVSGTYDTSLTIASATDIVVTGNITRSPNTDTAVLGLIANKFVRVAQYKPTNSGGNYACGYGTPDS